MFPLICPARKPGQGADPPRYLCRSFRPVSQLVHQLRSPHLHPPDSPAPEEDHRELNRVGVNLNELVRLMHSGNRSCAAPERSTCSVVFTGAFPQG